MRTTVFAAYALAGLLVGSLAESAHAAPRQAPSKGAIGGDGAGGPGIASYFFGSGFEADEGFATGSVEPQNGWSASGVNLPWQAISTANPFTGSQHVRLVRDPAQGQGVSRVLLSPTSATPANTPSTVYVKVNISNDGGADHHVIAQAPSQQMLTWQVVFSYSDGSNVGPGTIFVVDYVNNVLTFVNTGVQWVQGAYRELRVDFNPPAGSITYYYNGVLIHSGILIGATVLEQVGMLHDNYQLAGETADYDALSVQSAGEPPVGVQQATWTRVKMLLR